MDLRFKNYLQRYAITLKQVLTEKKSVATKPNQSSLAVSLLESRYMTLPLMHASASVKDLKRADLLGLSTKSGRPHAFKMESAMSHLPRITR